ncbi:MAG: phosphoglucosamine mutase [Chloroflexota bacterium]|nr:phosphoglucosamine mutase [Chloroflexota bacterium]
MGGLFGTDGIRGRANVEVTPALALALGRAVGSRVAGPGGSVALGRDTRRSGEMLVDALAAGLVAEGADVARLGVVTTPCLVYATTLGRHAAGVMVSASHNPAEDNGLKVVVDGRKVDDEAEADLEHLIEVGPGGEGVPNDRIGRMGTDPAAVASYAAHLSDAAEDVFAGLHIAIDCANGSASVIAPGLFTGLGAEIDVLCADPDGTNINVACGSTHPERLAELVAAGGFDLGFAFDGDADRLIAIDERGAIVDGDAMMGICALQRLATGSLRNDLLVATVMSNGGLERAILRAGGRMLRTPVGDRNVLEAMERHDAALGGEQSGHIIFRDRATTGDGLLTAIELVRAWRTSGVALLSELAGRIPRLPQVVLNSAARRRAEWSEDGAFAAAVADAEAQLADRGRILVRPSGTEPKLRIMVEGDEQEEIDRIARELAQLAEARLN